MNRNMRDYRDRRRNDRMDREYEDGRNPYGSRGGYVSSSRGRDRDYDDEGYDREYDRGYGDERMRSGRDGRMYFRGSFDRGYEDEAMRRGHRTRDREDYGYYDDYAYDGHGHGKGRLSKKELMQWQNKLCEHMDEQDCKMFEFDSVIHQAKEMQVKFDKFNEEEFYTTVLMMFTDYCESIGPNIPMYLALAKNFLEDDDARVKYGDKLAAYHDAIADI